MYSVPYVHPSASMPDKEKSTNQLLLSNFSCNAGSKRSSTDIAVSVQSTRPEAFQTLVIESYFSC